MSVPEPDMGANTVEILEEFGYSSDDIEKMQTDGVVNQCETSLPSKL